MKQHKGFTLIELLVVIAIIGLLSTMAVVAVSNARSKTRDAQRVTDVKQIQVALEFYYNEHNSYPLVKSPGVTLGASNAKVLASDTGFASTQQSAGTVYMSNINPNPTPGGIDYVYLSDDGSTYRISYAIENNVANITKGEHRATPEGMANP